MATNVRYRLRLIQNLSVASSATYGSATVAYGDGIYGERATDPANLQSYVAVPIGAGLGRRHAFEARVGDRWPTNRIAFKVMAFGGPFESGEGAVLDMSTVADAELRLDRISWGHAVTTGLRLQTPGTAPASSVADSVERIMELTDLTDPGTYRMTVILSFVSGRRLTIPVQDNLTLHVSDGGSIEVAPAPPVSSGVGPFDLWTGGTASTTGADSLTMGTASTTGTDTITLGDATS